MSVIFGSDFSRNDLGKVESYPFGASPEPAGALLSESDCGEHDLRGEHQFDASFTVLVCNQPVYESEKHSASPSPKCNMTLAAYDFLIQSS